MRRLLGTELTYAAIESGLTRLHADDVVAEEALRTVRVLFSGLHAGAIILNRNGAKRRAGLERHFESWRQRTQQQGLRG